MFEGGYQKWRVVAVGGSGEASYGDPLCVDRRGALDALLSSIYRASACLLTPARRLGDAPVYSYIGELKSDETVV